MDRSKGFVLFLLPDHVCINYAASEASTLRKRKKAESFMLMRGSLRCGGGWGVGGVPES